MSPEERKLLEEVVSLSRENHQLLKKMHRALWWQRLVFWLKWIMVILVALGAYYFIQPWIDQLIGLYGSLLPGLENLKSIQSFQGF